MNDEQVGLSCLRSPIHRHKAYIPCWESNDVNMMYNMQQKEQNVDPLVVNIRTIPDTRTADRVKAENRKEPVRQKSSSTTTQLRKKKIGNGVSDPRFKRVVSNNPNPLTSQTDACVGTENVSVNETNTPEMSVNSLSTTLQPDVPPFVPKRFVDRSPSPTRECRACSRRISPISNGHGHCLDDTLSPQRYCQYEKSCEPPKGQVKTPRSLSPYKSFASDQMTPFEEKISKLMNQINDIDNYVEEERTLQKSSSDCSVSTRNSSLCSNEYKDPPPSSYMNKKLKVFSWMKESQRPEKRRSVVTVIGQMKEQKFRNLTQGIMFRKQLAKELDKHAICKSFADEVDNNHDNILSKADFNSFSGMPLGVAFKTEISENDPPYKTVHEYGDLMEEAYGRNQSHSHEKHEKRHIPSQLYVKRKSDDTDKLKRRSNKDIGMKLKNFVKMSNVFQKGVGKYISWDRNSLVFPIVVLSLFIVWLSLKWWCEECTVSKGFFSPPSKKSWDLSTILNDLWIMIKSSFLPPETFRRMR